MHRAFIKYFPVFIFLLFSSIAFSQIRQVIIHGRVTDRLGKAVEYAAIQNADATAGTDADARGYYSLRVTLPATINVFALGFLKQQKQLQTSKDSMEVNFQLLPDISQIQEVTITANHLADAVKASPALRDFELKDNKLWLLYNLKKKSVIEVMDSTGKTLAQMTLPYRVVKDSINHTQHGFLYSTHKDSVLLYKLQDNTIQIKRMTVGTYKNFSEKLVAYRAPYYYYVNYDKVDTRVNYSYFDKPDSVRKVFYRYQDPKFERANREAKELMLALEGMMPSEAGGSGVAGTYDRLDTLVESLPYTPDPIVLKQTLIQIFEPQGASYEEIQGEMNEARDIIGAGNPDPLAAENELSRLHMQISRPATILRVVGDSAYIFNFDNNTLSVFGPTNEFVRELPLGIYIHSIDYREKDILVDKENQECYFTYEKWSHTYLGKINLVTGKVSYTIELKFFPVDKVRIARGYAYYIYFEGGQGYLYKQKLD